MKTVTINKTAAADAFRAHRSDVLMRLVPFTLLYVLFYNLLGHPSQLGLSFGLVPQQIALGVIGGVVIGAGAMFFQYILTPIKGVMHVPADNRSLLADCLLLMLNAPVEELFFRGLMQGGLTMAFGPLVGIVVATSVFVLYHKLGGWVWADVAAVAFLGVPVALCYWLMPGPQSVLGITIMHLFASAGFLGVGPYILHRTHLVA